MEESNAVMNKVPLCGAYRETAWHILERKIEELQRSLAGYKALLKNLEGMEEGSPLEECIWNLLLRARVPD